MRTAFALVVAALLATACGSPSSPVSPSLPTPTPGLTFHATPRFVLASGSTTTVRVMTQPRVLLRFTVDAGALSAAELFADDAGHALVTVTAAQTVTLGAQPAGGPAGFLALPVVAPFRVRLHSNTNTDTVTIPTNVPAVDEPIAAWHGTVTIESIGAAANHQLDPPVRVSLSCGGTGSTGSVDWPGFTGARQVRCGFRGASGPHPWSAPYVVTVDAASANGWSAQASLPIRVQ